MLRGRQGGIVHVTSVGPGGVGEACGGAWAMVPAWIWVSGGIAALGARHAGDTPLEGFAWRKSPRRLDSSHVVSPQARCERRADLRNDLVWMLQIVPADADDVPALGFEVALALALAGK